MKVGTYKARPVNLAVKQTDSGKQFMKCLFEVKTDEGNQNLSWTGWLTPKAMPYTLKAMFKVGLTGRSLRDLLGGESGENCINTKTLVDVTVNKSTDQNGQVRTDDNGQAFYEVSFIGGPAMDSDQEALKKLDHRNLISQMMKIEETNNKTTTNYQTQQQMTADIPF